MKKIKTHEHKPWCTWCKAQGKEVAAMWRQSAHGGSWACEKHRESLHQKEKDDARRNQHMTEADYMTWGRL